LEKKKDKEMSKFGINSLDELSTCHLDLVKIHNLAIQRSRVDYGISEGQRPTKRQQLLFKQGKSKIDGVTKKGKHNFIPSLATDFYIYHPDPEIRQKLAYDKCSLSYVAGILVSCAEELYQAGEITHKLRWGGNWDMDGVIIMDQSFDDLCHVELIKV
jgi:peptidoglycan L-alanyl-D-glutamate endopeptidase CwlK